MSLLEVKHVSKTYGSRNILNDINLTFGANKIYGLLGRNGSGKSTLLNIITNRIFANDGDVTIDSESVVENDQKLGQIYLMSEAKTYSDSERLTNILKDTDMLYGGFNWDLSQRLISEFGIDLKQKLGKLSTGYTSLFKLVIAMCVPAKFVFLDEPVLGLDANHREIFYSELLQSFADNPRTFVITTHLIEEIAKIISEVVILDDRQIIVEGSVESILDKAHAVVGPVTDVDQYVNHLNVIGTETMANLKTAYVYGDLDDRILPDTVSLAGFDLQKLFVYLTNPTSKEVSDNEI